MCKNLNVKMVIYLFLLLIVKFGEVNNKYFMVEYFKGYIGIRSVNVDFVD